jgi:hypothetical protein
MKEVYLTRIHFLRIYETLNRNNLLFISIFAELYQNDTIPNEVNQALFYSFHSFLILNSVFPKNTNYQD